MGFEAALASDAEQAQLVALRKALNAVPPLPGPALDDDLCLLRFLRGYAREKEPLRAAAAAFEAMLIWREDHSMDAARAELLAAGAAEPTWPAALPRFAALVASTGAGLVRRLGWSKDGLHPVTLCLIHKYDVSGVLRSKLGDDLLAFQRYVDEYWLLELHRLSVAAGRVVGRVELVYTADMKLNHFGFRAVRFFPKILAGSKHFPESARRIVSIGNNKVAVALYQRVIRPFVPAHTKEKLIILGRDLRSARVVAAMDLDAATTAALDRAAGRTAAVDDAPRRPAPADDAGAGGAEGAAPPPPPPDDDGFVLVEPPTPPSPSASLGSFGDEGELVDPT
ncbi:hypothetical protein SO694_00143033 [Aureococcus anophagefferens]|uniref:CRAL-TRIO domain-containing protein n=1 Tax=Aureococcus anophagefferens TaxID=44056 RepID=A0ABR1FPP7_AURAN